MDTLIDLPEVIEQLPEELWPQDTIVGYLTPHPSGRGYGIHCRSCRKSSDGATVYLVNLRPYKATCIGCGDVLYQGCGTELFDGS